MVDYEALKTKEKTLREGSHKATAEGLTASGLILTPTQASALFRAVENVALGYSGGVTAVKVESSHRGKISVEVHARSKGFEPELVWVGHIGVRGAVRGRYIV